MKIILKIILSIFCSIIAWLPVQSYFLEDLGIPFKTVLLISITALIYVNWSIWSKGLLKKFVMFFVMFLYLGIGAYFFSELAGIESDYCIEDGDCEQGYIYKNRPIDEQYCNELKGEWIINPKHINYCKLKYYGQ